MKENSFPCLICSLETYTGDKESYYCRSRTKDYNDTGKLKLAGLGISGNLLWLGKIPPSRLVHAKVSEICYTPGYNEEVHTSHTDFTDQLGEQSLLS